MNLEQRPYNPFTWDVWTAAWAFWMVWFVIFETWALLSGNDETFSHHVWWLRNNSPSIVFFLLVGILTWLVYHFVVEGR